MIAIKNDELSMCESVFGTSSKPQCVSVANVDKLTSSNQRLIWEW